MTYKSYRRLVYAVPLFVFVYLCIISTQHWLHDRGEIFPFFNWSLFSKPKAVADRFTVRVLAVDRPTAPAAKFVGKVVTEPRALRFLSTTNFQKTALRLSRVLAGRESASLQRSKELLDNFVRSAGVTSYEVVRIFYDPLDHYFKGDIKRTKVIVRLDVGKPL